MTSITVIGQTLLFLVGIPAIGILFEWATLDPNFEGSYIFVGSYFIFAPFIMIGYGLWPLKFKPADFRKRGYDLIVIEFTVMKKIFMAEISILILILILYNTLPPSDFTRFLFTTGYGFVIAFVGIGLRMCTQYKNTDFYLYYAKGSCLISSRKEDLFEKMNYL